jgi:autotransporter strand-loop-strand O-heptosyltransferase
LFVAPNTEIKNVYAQYYIGANEENNPIYSPFNSKYIPLQKVASQILGLEHKEIRPELTWLENKDYKKPSDRKYVCISEKASHHKKEWKEINGWQKVVDFINSKGYDVVVISKEETDLKNVINKTGNIHLQNRIKDIAYAELFIGCSSGLSWLSWAIGTKTMIISDVTPSFHEPQEGVIRFNETNGKVVDYENFKTTSYTKVINELERVLK